MFAWVIAQLHCGRRLVLLLERIPLDAADTAIIRNNIDAFVRFRPTEARAQNFQNAHVKNPAHKNEVADILEEAMQLVVTLKWAVQMNRGMSPDLETEVSIAVRKLAKAKDELNVVPAGLKCTGNPTSAEGTVTWEQISTLALESWDAPKSSSAEG